MRKSILTRFLAGILTVCLLLGNLAPVTAFATDSELSEETFEAGETSTTEETSETEETAETEETPETEETAEKEETSETEETAETEEVSEIGEIPETEAADGASDEEDLYVDSYADFVKELKVLEGYAAEYAATSGKNAGELILNFLRTGVDRYNDGNWKTLAGEEITGFTSYVSAQDTAQQTTAMRLRNIELFTLPNGQQVDFGHMFGTMNIAYISAQASADLGGWAGDICDLMLYSKEYGSVPEGTVEEMAEYIRLNCFGVDADDAFGMDDFYGDMDAFYLVAQMKAGKTLSTVMEAYFTTSLTDEDRAEYFLKNRFENLYTKDSVREAVYNAYKSNVGLQVLESGRDLADEADLRTASCYAFADYLYELAGDTLEEPAENPTDPSEPEEDDDEESEDPEQDNPYYSVFSSTTSVLAPGITQTISYAQTADDKQIVYYIANVDVTRDDVTIMAGYRDADPSKGWGMQRVLDQAEALEAKHSDPADEENYIENFHAVVATNGAGFNMSTGEPSGLLVMNGVEWHPVNSNGFFAILKDGTAKIGTTAEYAAYKDQIQEAIAGFGSVLVLDGEIVATSDGSRASRTAIGIKADGSVVMMVLDGRQEPFSAGGSMAEIAQIMKDAGCVHAINLDGGGSTTFVSKPEGSDDLSVINRPSDGYQRSVSTSLIAVSTAKSSKEFDHANIASDYDYLTVGTSLELTAVGVSASGSSAEIPEGAAWQVSDSSIGSVANGVFTAAALGDVEVQLLVDGEIVGSKTLHVVVPDALSMEYTTMNVVYGKSTKLPLQASYGGNPVAFSASDVYVVLQYSNAGSTDGLYFTIDEASEYRTLMAGAALMSDFNIIATVTLNCYKADETMFDFSEATAGDERFAWIREVTNAEELDGDVYQIEDLNKEMEVSYVFALDMQSIEIPAKLRDLTSMLPGGDDQSTTAWQYLLRLAERVSTLTTVTIVAEFDPDLEIDCSEMTISNDFFEFESATVDEVSNTLTITATWIDRTAAVDPSTASSLCILSGIKATPKDGAEWNAKNRLNIINAGQVGYKIYLRASSLYSFANIEHNQQTYGLYPFSRVLEDGTTESGAYFEDTYASFEDKFTLDKTNRQGWYSTDSCLYYYKNNVVLTGTQLLPSYEDPSVYLAYSFDENGACLGTITGFYELNGGLYYAINGVRKVGWQAIIGADGQMGYYYFQYGTGKALTGEQVIDGYTYTFEDYILVKGQLVKDSKGTRYRWAGNWAFHEWLEIDGNISYAQANGYFATGIKWMYSPEGVWSYYVMDDDGVWLQDLNGLYEWNGGTYLVKDGFAVNYPGLFELDGDYYYISSTNVLIKDRTYWISKTNGIVPEGSYQFDADGKMILETTPPVTDPDDGEETPDTPETEVKNGIVAENGSLYYYVDGKLNYAGLIKIDENYYYVRGTGELVVSRSYWVTKNNGLLPSKTYEFDELGRIVFEDDSETPETPDTPDTPEPEVKNGIVEENGGLYYYVDGKLNYAGLIKIGDYYYYVRGTGQLVTDCKYWPTKTNGIMTTTRQYTFDEEGRMTDCDFDGSETPDTPETPEPEVKNGIVAENGSLYYYVDGVLNYAGLIKIDGYFYYVRGTGELVHDCEYWPTKTNGWFTTTRRYTFDSEGKMVDPPV